MADPYLDKGEFFIITTHRISTGFAIYDMILTTQHLVLVDSSSKRFEPEKIPLSSILSVTAGKVATGEPAIVLNFFEPDAGEEKQPMNLIFTQQPGELRKRERDVWVRDLMQQIVAVRQKEDSGDRRDIVNGEGYIRPTSTPLHEIETAQPHKSVVSAEPAAVDVTVLPEKNAIPEKAPDIVPEHIPEDPVIPDTIIRQEGGTGPVFKDVAVSPAVPAPVTPSQEPVHAEPGKPGTPERNDGIPPVPVPETAVLPDPFAGAVLAMKEREEAPDVRFTPEFPGPEEPGQDDGKAGLFARILHALSGPLAEREAGGSTTTGDESSPEPRVPEPVVQEPVWPVLPQEPEPVTIPVPEAPAPAAPVTKPDGIPEIVPPADATACQKTPEKSRQPTGILSGIVLTCIVFLVIIAVSITYHPGGTGIQQVTTLPQTPVPSATVPAQPGTPNPTLAQFPAETPASSVSSGVWVRVACNGSFKGRIGNPGSLQTVGGTGEHYYWIRDAGSLVQASLEKLEYSADPLVVTVYQNGTEIYNNRITAPRGALDFIIDSITGGFPGGIPTPTSATGLVPGEVYRY